MKPTQQQPAATRAVRASSPIVASNAPMAVHNAFGSAPAWFFRV